MRPRAALVPPFAAGALAGLFAGLLAGAAFVKRAASARAGADGDALAVVAIFDDVRVKSSSRAFSGGSILAWFGGAAVDLREAAPAPGAHLAVSALFGGIAVRTPPGWRIDARLHTVLGGIAAGTPARDDPEAPVLVVEGRAVFGGLAVGSRADA